MSTKLLEKIAGDVSFLKEQVIEIKTEIDEISSDLHIVRPEYRKRVSRIQKEGSFNTYSDIRELRKAIENVQD